MREEDETPEIRQKPNHDLSDTYYNFTILNGEQILFFLDKI